MKNKLLMGVGIAFAIFVVFLLILCGGSSSSGGTVTQEQYEILVDKIQVRKLDDEIKNIPLSILTDNIQFNAEIENNAYKRIEILNKKNYKSKGVVFLVKAESDSNITFTLYKNDEVLKSTNLSLEANTPTDVELLLSTSIEINTTDKYFVEIGEVGENKTRFVFDCLLSFFDEA